MAIKETITSLSKIIASDRLEPRYYLILDKLEELKSKKKVMDLGDKKILKSITDGEHAGQIFVESGVRFIKNSSVKEFGINLLDDFYITEDKHNKLSRSALKAENILFTTIGHLGSTAIVPFGFGEANINQNLVKIEVNKETIDPYYLAAYLNSNLVKKQIKSLFTGNIHSILTYPKIKSIKIVIPDRAFENRISEDYKTALNKDAESYNLIKEAQALFYKNVKIDFKKIEKENTFEVNLSNFINDDLWTAKFSYPLYVKTAQALKNNWEIFKLGQIVNIKNGDEVGSDNYNEYLDKKDDDVPFIRTSDLVNFEIDHHTDFYIPNEIYTSLNQKIKNNDILFTKDGKIACCAMVTESDKAIIASGISRLRLKEDINKICSRLSPYYLFLVLTLPEIGKFQALKYTVTASTIPHLREDRLKDIEIPVIDEKSIKDIDIMIKRAFELKSEKKDIIKNIVKQIDYYCEV